MHKSMKKGKYTVNLIPRNKFSMGKPHSMKLEVSSHHEPQMSRGKNTKPFFSPSIFSSTHSYLVPERITGSCMTMAKSLKPDFSYHLTFFRKVSRDLNVTHWEPSSHHVLPGAGERHSTRDKGHEEGGSAYAKAGSSLGSAPGYSRASTPQKTRVCLLYCFVLSPLTLLGAVPHHHLTLSVKELTYSSN